MNIFDPHTHSIASGHVSTSTINDMARSAAAKNLTLLGITDHGPATPGSCKLSYFHSLKAAPANRFGIPVLYGAEANILDYNGLLDLDDATLNQLDYAIASLHIQCLAPGTLTENTNAYIQAMKHPGVKIIGHPDDVKYPVGYEMLIRAAIKHHVVLEINNSSLSPDGYRGNTWTNNKIILSLCKHYNHPVVLSSDSHGADKIGDFTYAYRILNMIDFPRRLILNYNRQQFLDFIGFQK